MSVNKRFNVAKWSEMCGYENSIASKREREWKIENWAGNVDQKCSGEL
jgi:hypothetical protein